jgi:hypothetical protein
VRLVIFANDGRTLWEDQIKNEASKVRVQGVNEWPACKSMKLASQITGVKDIHVRIHIWNIL